MANPYRGEAPLVVGDETIELRLTWRTMGKMIARFGDEWDVELHKAFGVYDMETIADALAIASDRDAAFFLDASPPLIPVREAWTAAYNLFLFGVPSLEEEPQAQKEGETTPDPLPQGNSWSAAGNRLLRRVWRRRNSGAQPSPRSSSTSGHVARA